MIPQKQSGKMDTGIDQYPISQKYTIPIDKKPQESKNKMTTPMDVSTTFMTKNEILN
jgi:hypothetical protein